MRNPGCSSVECEAALIRYPGGCFADGYHWKDGIGPRASRPRRLNRMWFKLGPRLGPMEDNHFGTDEFLALCREVGAEPMLTVNVGSGTVSEAMDWVEYVNGPASFGMGAERARNGHPQPYGVKYWFVGNEIFGGYEIGHLTPEKYARVFLDFAQGMRKVDPSIKLIACGNHYPLNTGSDFANQVTGGQGINRAVLEGAGMEADYLSVHQYAPCFISLKNLLLYQLLHLKRSKSRWIYYEVLGTYRQMESFLEKCIADVKAYSPHGRLVPLALDEWNLWFYFLSDLLNGSFSLRDGLWTATVLNLFHRHAPFVPITNIAQLVNCVGIISSDSNGTFLSPSALAFKLYTEKAGGGYLPCKVDGPEIPHKSALPMLDVSATSDPGRLALFLVNRSYDSPLGVRCSIRGMKPMGGARLTEMHHPNPVQYNSSTEPGAVRLASREIEPVYLTDGSGSAFEIFLKPHSLTCIELAVG
jgi:alpha-N-arabinofuranosidase